MADRKFNELQYEIQPLSDLLTECNTPLLATIDCGFNELQFEIQLCFDLDNDSQSVIHLMRNAVYHAKAKQIEIRYLFNK